MRQPKPPKSIDFSCNWFPRIKGFRSSALSQILGALAQYGKDDGCSSPSLAEIENDTLYGRASIIRYLAVLETTGWIARAGTRTSPDGNTINVYRVKRLLSHQKKLWGLEDVLVEYRKQRDAGLQAGGQP